MHRLAPLFVGIALTLFVVTPSMAGSPQTNDTMFGIAIVGNDTLAKANGKEGLSLNDANITSVHKDNQANGATSGAASIGSNALSNFDGVSAVVVNSGQNAVVQVNQQIILNLY